MSFKAFSGLITASIILFLSIFGVVLYATVLTSTEIEKSDNVMAKIVDSLGIQRKSYNILVLGTDFVAANTDVMLLVHINGPDETVSVMSLPRDTKVRIRGSADKINSAYLKGKSELAKEVVSGLLGIPVQYYIAIDTKAFREVIDLLGGVRFNVPMDMDYEDPYQDLYIHLKKGDQLLDGNKAEMYMRFRKGYALGDLGRVEAQKLFLRELVKQKLTPDTLLKANSIIETVFKNVQTDITVDDYIRFASNLKDLSPDSINFYTLPGEINENGYYYCNVQQTEKLVKDLFASAGYNGYVEGIAINDLNSGKTTPAAPTAAPSKAPTPTPTNVVIDTDKYKPTPTPRPQATATPIPTPSPSGAPTGPATPTVTPVPSGSPSGTPTVSPTPTPGVSVTPPAVNPSPTPAPTPATTIAPTTAPTSTSTPAPSQSGATPTPKP